MHIRTMVLTGGLLAASVPLVLPGYAAGQKVPPPRGGDAGHVDLGNLLASASLRPQNCEVTRMPGTNDAVRIIERPGNGIVWIDGTDFAEGTIEVDVRGRDVFQQSFLGIAFHRKDDKTYESVYLRPFNFRADDPVRRQHAVQYMALPDWEWPRLRKEFPGEFENPVDQSMSPTDWVRLRVVVQAKTVQVFVGSEAKPALEARKLGDHHSGTVGLWTGNNSDGEFANLRIMPSTATR